MEDYQITEDAKNGFDLLVKIKLKQWREYGTKTVSIRFDMEKPKAAAGDNGGAGPSGGADLHGCKGGLSLEYR